MDVEVWERGVFIVENSVICKVWSWDNPLLWDCSKFKNGSTFVRNISKLLDENHRASNIVNQGFQVVVGNGERIRFWQDLRWDLKPMKCAFPRIYALAVNKFGFIKEFGNVVYSKWVWNVELRRPVFNWEIEQWNCFQLALDCINIRYNLQGSLTWSFTKNSCFSVSSFRRCLEDKGMIEDQFFNFLWQGVCPPKVEIFVWQMLKGRVLVREVLLNFGVGQSESTFCPMCDGGSESIDHVFLFIM
ncbi:hypothetical protein Ddye_009883 [Dipteronia dyeriana]|uniref:Reverse transcriptase zinc-binding domain-containing protein n=1 Tax=Dipteronia dyeriana TaxID=168575 RepID=A0AAE0CMR8_9ROSI|nr:hypothetical protein Ddye_009883 [Dipteronia dyeriana]